MNEADVLPSAAWKRAFMRRTGKSRQFEQELICRHICCPGSHTSRSKVRGTEAGTAVGARTTRRHWAARHYKESTTSHTARALLGLMAAGEYGYRLYFPLLALARYRDLHHSNARVVSWGF